MPTRETLPPFRVFDANHGTAGSSSSSSSSLPYDAAFALASSVADSTGMAPAAAAAVGEMGARPVAVNAVLQRPATLPRAATLLRPATLPRWACLRCQLSTTVLRGAGIAPGFGSWFLRAGGEAAGATAMAPALAEAVEVLWQPQPADRAVRSVVELCAVTDSAVPLPAACGGRAGRCVPSLAPGGSGAPASTVSWAEDSPGGREGLKAWAVLPLQGPIAEEAADDAA